MPKIKTNRSAAKRFRVTGSGKIKRAKAGKRHILTKKNGNKIRNLSLGSLVDKSNENAIKRLIPYKF